MEVSSYILKKGSSNMAIQAIVSSSLLLWLFHIVQVFHQETLELRDSNCT